MRDRSTRRHWSPALGLLVAGGFVLMVTLSKATQVLGAASIPIWAMVVGGAVFLFRGPFGEAVLRSLASGDQDPESMGTDPAVLQELDDLRAQVGELQERMDFTERLLAREREMRPLGSGEAT
jgi:hypothetical protein